MQVSKKRRSAEIRDNNFGRPRMVDAHAMDKKPLAGALLAAGALKLESAAGAVGEDEEAATGVTPRRVLAAGGGAATFSCGLAAESAGAKMKGCGWTRGTEALTRRSTSSTRARSKWIVSSLS
jgi:hypothetical protein